MSASRRRFDVKAMRVPSGDQAGSRSAARPAVSRVAAPVSTSTSQRCGDPVVGEAGPVEHVVEPVDEPIVRRRRGAGRPHPIDAATTIVVGRGRAMRGADDDQPLPVGRPLERVHAARQVGQPARLAAIERQEVDLLEVLAVLRLTLGPERLFLDQRASVRDERERRAVRRETRMMIVLRAEGQLPRRRRTVRRDDPQRVAVTVEAGRHGLQRDDGVTPVGRQARLGGDTQAVQVVWAGGSGHVAVLQRSGRPKSSGLPSGDDGRPALAAPRGRPAARSPGPAADASAPATRRVRFGPAPVRAVVGRRAGAGHDRARRRRRRRRGPDPGR